MGHAVADDATFESTTEPHARPSLAPLVSPDMRVDTFALWVAFSSCLLAIYLGFSWLPSILSAAGLGQAAASGSLTVFNLGGVPGAIVGGWAIARFGSRRAMLLLNALAIAAALALSAITIDAHAQVTPILAMLALTGGLVNAVQVTMYALAAHVYPTVVRATGVGVAVAVGRIGAIVSGVAGPVALDYRGSASFFWLMAATLGVTFVALAVVHRHIPPPSLLEKH
jgi:AAHS family 4-hydroxybenzoate transporter-like MFS transporter